MVLSDLLDPPGPLGNRGHKDHKVYRELQVVLRLVQVGALG
jgi:hypothetical protein